MVISAGLAELAAGSISMSLGGYLAAKETASAAAQDEGISVGSPRSYSRLLDNGDMSDVESCSEEKTVTEANESASGAAHRYLAPLELPAELQSIVLAHITQRTDVQLSLQERENKKEEDSGDSVEQPCSPVVSGASIGLGYLFGGLIPLLPYFFVHQVDIGLRISFGICVLSLFTFGFVRAYFSSANTQDSGFGGSRQRPAVRLRRSVWEGFIMAGLGMAAAFAAVVCVRLAPDVAGTSQ
jgi:vacuolar iron transporter family protein